MKLYLSLGQEMYFHSRENTTKLGHWLWSGYLHLTKIPKQQFKAMALRGGVFKKQNPHKWDQGP